MRLVPPDQLLVPLSDALAGGECVVPCADAATAAMARPDEPLEVEAALIVATSGSTGEPKGVMLSAAALAASASATHARLGGPGTWHCALPTTYVAGVMTLVRAHFAGTQPVFAASDLADLQPREGRNYLSLVPTQLIRALDDPARTAALARFDALLIGGAPLAPSVRERARRAGIALVTTYGASETSGGCVYDGVPLDGVQVTLDGERVVLGGPTIFAGYRLRPDLTAQALHDGRFVTHDRGVLEAGRLRVLGRLDDVVISGGVNVDLAAAQRTADAVLGVPDQGGIVLVGVEDPEWGTRIVALTTGPWTIASIRERLGHWLQRAALPREVRHSDSLPRTASGKIDRRSIAANWR